MRVTANAYSNALLQQLNSLALRQTQLHNTAASGQRITNPADDPAGVRRLMQMEQSQETAAQFRNNITVEKDRATAVFSSLKALKTVSDRVGEIATLADGLRSPEELAVYAAEVDQLLNQALQVANTKYQGAYLFAGTRSDQPAFSAVRNAANQLTGAAYQGNQDVPLTEIAQGQALSTRMPGANGTGAGERGLFQDAAAGADFFTHLVALRDHLQAGDVDAIRNDRAALLKDEDNLLFHIGRNGVMQSQLLAADSVLAGEQTALDQQISRVADADLTETLVRLNSTQTAYQAALQSGARLLDLSLINFLR